jgi:hypothetical protein
MELILKSFRDYFGNKIEIPNELGMSGTIDDLNSGWFIKYVLNTLEDGKQYLDFTADHRMTNPRHHRITSDGEVEFLEMYQEGFSYNSEILGNYEIQQEKYYEHNRNVSRILIKKGLMNLEGNESLFENNE